MRNAKGFVAGLVIGLMIANASALDVTIGIPSIGNLDGRVIDALSLGEGWVDADGEGPGNVNEQGQTKAQYAILVFKNWVTAKLKAYEAREAGQAAYNAAQAQAETDAEAITVNGS